MSLTSSTMLPLGTRAPDFTLPDAVSGKLFSLASGKPTVIVFMCNHCPYVKHILPKLLEVVLAYQPKNINFIAINSNDTEKYPEDAPEKMQHLAQTLHFSFPYLFDITQETAENYHAACTPDFYVFDRDLQCVYRGRFDDSTPGNNIPVTGKELCAAMDNLLAQKPISADQSPSMGCNIKWKV